jgi:hypothetical protein
MSRAARILPGPRCGGPEACGVKGAHSAQPGERRIWTFHDVQCQVPNPRPVADPDPAGPVQCKLPGYLDGYPVCSFVDGHLGDCGYRRDAAASADPEPEAEAEP